MLLDYIALGLLVFVALVIFYGIIVIHDIPYEIAVERDHPHADAIHVAGWVSLFTLHAIWPFLWIWATLWRKERGWGFKQLRQEHDELQSQILSLHRNIEHLHNEIDALKAQRSEPTAGSMTQQSEPRVEPEQTESQKAASTQNITPPQEKGES